MTSITDSQERRGGDGDSPSVPQSMSEYVATVLREQILSGQHGFGARLEQRRIAEDLGVSVIPVREGLRQLEAEGLVTLRARHGAFVAMYSHDELRELSEVRQVLDPLATRHGVERMTDATLERLAALVEETRGYTERGDIRALSRVDRVFHLTIYAEAQMPILLQVITGLRDRYAVYSRLCLEMPGYSPRSLREHEEIFKACKARDADRAADLMHAHLSFALDALLDQLPTSDGDGSPASGS